MGTKKLGKGIITAKRNRLPNMDLGELQWI